MEESGVKCSEEFELEWGSAEEFPLRGIWLLMAKEDEEDDEEETVVGEELLQFIWETALVGELELDETVLSTQLLCL